MQGAYIAHTFEDMLRATNAAGACNRICWKHSLFQVQVAAMALKAQSLEGFSSTPYEVAVGFHTKYSKTYRFYVRPQIDQVKVQFFFARSAFTLWKGLLQTVKQTSKLKFTKTKCIQVQYRSWASL